MRPLPRRDPRAPPRRAPGVWFPFRKNRIQRLTVVSGGEAETIVSHVEVEFDEAHSLPNCFPYAPPRVNVSLYGKGHLA